ncbi:MAG: site-specific integrase, partial [Planctomycetes bacterium]|nr:site-specific integrase [Planctomycetota bacterium]
MPYRRNEIGSVCRRSFDFDSDPPTMTVEAAYSKHRRKDVIPLRSDFADMIRPWIESKLERKPSTPLFDVTNKRTSEMLRKDLGRAREEWLEESETPSERKERERSSFLCYVDHDGHYADFHALRKTFITNLSKAGASPKIAQTLARHSDINLTMNTYTMLDVYDQKAAVESLPPIPKRDHRRVSKRIRATGTDDVHVATILAPSVVPTVVPRSAKTGAIQLASQTSESVSDRTDKRARGARRKTSKDAKTPEENGASGMVLHQTALDDTKYRRGDSNPHEDYPHWILNPARLPI